MAFEEFEEHAERFEQCVIPDDFMLPSQVRAEVLDVVDFLINMDLVGEGLDDEEGDELLLEEAVDGAQVEEYGLGVLALGQGEDLLLEDGQEHVHIEFLLRAGGSIAAAALFASGELALVAAGEQDFVLIRGGRGRLRRLFGLDQRVQLDTSVFEVLDDGGEVDIAVNPGLLLLVGLALDLLHEAADLFAATGLGEVDLGVEFGELADQGGEDFFFDGLRNFGEQFEEN